MKYCPQCKNNFDDDSLAQCPNDGATLTDAPNEPDVTGAEADSAPDPQVSAPATDPTDTDNPPTDEPSPPNDDLPDLAPEETAPEVPAEAPPAESESPIADSTDSVDIDALSKELELNSPPPPEAPPETPAESAPEELVPSTKFTTGASDSPAPSVEDNLVPEEPSNLEDTPITQAPSKSHKKALMVSLSILAVVILAVVIGVIIADTSGVSHTNPKVKFTSTPAGAEVFIDGKSAGKAPITIGVSPGKHKVEFRENGFDTVVEIITVDEDGTVFSRQLTPAAAP